MIKPLATLAVGLLLAGCSAPSSQGPSPAPAAPESATVTIEAFQFKPASVTVRAGGTVTFLNKDAAPHTASPAEGAAFTGTGALESGQSRTVAFGTAGAQAYFCDFHPSMKGVVNVQ